MTYSGGIFLVMKQRPYAHDRKTFLDQIFYAVFSMSENPATFCTSDKKTLRIHLRKETTQTSY